MTGPEPFAVVVPARDEEQSIVPCLRSVLATGPDLVVVVAHRCTDATELLAKEVLGELGVVITDDSPHVSGARRHGAAEALDLLPGDPDRTWLLSTDADTVVPPDWAGRILALGWAGADAVAGLADLDSYDQLEPVVRQRYRALVEEGLDGAQHHHAYAANLGVRVSAYLAAGGWPVVEVGEEHALLAALAGAGRNVVRSTGVVVRTSGRRAGRARGGLADLLATMAEPLGGAGGAQAVAGLTPGVQNGLPAAMSVRAASWSRSASWVSTPTRTPSRP